MKSQLDHASTVQELLANAAKAYSNVIRNRLVLNYARQSEESIRKQTGMEEIKVREGAGLSTDVLQAKRQLAGAQARRVQNENTLRTSINDYVSIFGRPPPTNLFTTPRVKINTKSIPQTLKEVMDISNKNNYILRTAQIDIESKNSELQSATRSELFPTVEFEYEQVAKVNVSGTEGYEYDSTAMLKIDYSFNFGLSSVNSIMAAKKELSKSRFQKADHVRSETKKAYNAWHNLINAKKRASILREQAEIAKAFLKLAREERKLGNRSLLDVLSGETALYNAQSDAVSAEFDILDAEINLLTTMGMLSIKDFPSR